MAAGGWALGLGQGLLGAGDAIKFLAQQRQQAQEIALQKATLAMNEQQRRDAAAAQTQNMMPGGQTIDPDLYNKFFAGTPSSAFWQHQAAVSPNQSVQQIEQAPAQPLAPAAGSDLVPEAAGGNAANLLPQIERGPVGDLGSGAPVDNPRPEQYKSVEPLAQWRTGRMADASLARTGLQQAGANYRAELSATTRSKIAAAEQAIQAKRNEIIQRLGQERDQTRRLQLQQGLARLQQAQAALNLQVVRDRALQAQAAARISNSGPVLQQGMLQSFGIDVPSPPGYSPDNSQYDQVQQMINAVTIPGTAAPKSAPKTNPSPNSNDPAGILGK